MVLRCTLLTVSLFALAWQAQGAPLVSIANEYARRGDLRAMAALGEHALTGQLRGSLAAYAAEEDAAAFLPVCYRLVDKGYFQVECRDQKDAIEEATGRDIGRKTDPMVFKAELFDFPRMSDVLMRELVWTLAFAYQDYGRPGKEDEAPRFCLDVLWTVKEGEEWRFEPFLTYWIWSRPGSQKNIVRFLRALYAVDPEMGTGWLFEQTDPQGSLPLYLAIAERRNEVAKAMLDFYTPDELLTLRGEDVTNTIEIGWFSKQRARVSVFACAALAGNREIEDYLSNRMEGTKFDATAVDAILDAFDDDNEKDKKATAQLQEALPKTLKDAVKSWQRQK